MPANVYGDFSVARTLLTGSPVLAWFGDSIAIGLEGSIMRTCPARLKGVWVDAATMAGYNGGFFSFAAAAYVDETLNDPAAFTVTTEIIFGAEANVFSNRIIEGSDGAFMAADKNGRVKDGLDWLADESPIVRVLYDRDPDAVGGSKSLFRLRQSTDNVNPVAESELIDFSNNGSPYGPTLLTLTTEQPVDAGASLAFGLYAHPGGTTLFVDHFAAVFAFCIQRTGTGITFAPLTPGGNNVTDYLDDAVYPTAKWAQLETMGVTHVLIAVCIHNEMTYTKAEFKADLLELIDRVRTGAGDADLPIILATSHEPYDAGTWPYDDADNHYAYFAEGCVELAEEAGATGNILTLDCHAVYGSAKTLNDAGLIPDGTHWVDPEGKMYAGQVIWDLITLATKSIADIVITPFQAVTSNPGHAVRDLAPTLQHSAPAHQWTVTDGSGDPVDLFGVTLRLTVWAVTDTGDTADRFDDVLEGAWQYETGGEGITISGEDRNVVTVQHDHENNAVAGDYRYCLWNVDDRIPLARGKMPIIPAVFSA